jgi:GAF domain-containing protein
MSNEKQKNHLGTVLDYDDSSSLRDALENCTSCSELDWRTFNLDTANSHEESLSNELKRLQALKSYRILDTDRKPQFERLTALAARIFDVPICLVSLVDLGRQWFSSNRGLGDVRETPRKVAFCAHSLLSKEDVFIVPDALKDPRFRTNSLVTGEPNIRFYAGSPLVTRDGYKLGTLCIIDVKPRPNGLSLSEKQNLNEIAALAMDQIASTKIDLERAEMSQAKMIACTAHDLITPLTSIQLNMGLITEDEALIDGMTKGQKDIIRNTKECVDIMSSICQHSIRSFRGKSTEGLLDIEHHEEGTVNISKYLNSLDHIIATHPKKVPLKMRVDKDVPPIIKSEVLSIFRSSLNFLTNACKVTESGSIDFHLYMRYLSEHQTENFDSLVFECTDTGPGIDKEDYSRLFTADGGLQLSQETKVGGLGLGLHSVSELITGLGGDYGYKPK